MKLILLAIFVFFFAVLPMYLLDATVMPGLNSIKQSYDHAAAAADMIAQGN